jgi:hypothetical protein
MVRINVGDPSLEPRRVLWGEERFQAVQSIHEGEGHCGGFEKTRIKVAQRYWFPSLTTFVRQYVRHCDLCQKENAGKAPRCDREIFPTPPTAPWFRVHVGVDLCGPFEPSGPLKYRYVAVAVDLLTKFVEMKPLVGSPKKGVDPEEVANFVQKEVFHRYADVFEVVTDCGPEFSSLFSALCTSWGATHVHILARNPQANGQVERYMQVIKAALRKCADENPTEWHIYVSGICLDIRNKAQESIGMSPYKALFGREPILPTEMRFPTSITLVRPDLDMEETAEQKEFRFKQMETSQSICKALILGAQRVQAKIFARWSQKRKRRTDLLKKDDWILLKKPGTIVGSRLRWEGLIFFWARRMRGVNDKP